MEKPAASQHPIHDLIRRRWSPRAFAPRPVPAADVAALFEAARWAASSTNEQPWRFIVATKANPDDHARLLEVLLPGNAVWAKDAPVLVLTVAKSTFTKNGAPNRHAFHDVGVAVAQLTLEATARGLGLHQMAGIDPVKARTTFAIPADFEPVTALAIGYPGEPEQLPPDLAARERAERTRKPLGELVFSKTFGQSAPL
jgi:nitroreductase